MITTLVHGVSVHDDTEGSIIQSLDVEHKAEESNTSGMVDGKTQIVRTTTHSDSFNFSVTGRGDLTMVAGTDDDAQLTLISGGVTNILSFKYTQKLGVDSEWTYSGNAYPHAA